MNDRLLIVDYNLADALTLCGVCAAVTAAMLLLGGSAYAALSLLYLAIFFDGIDGAVARKFNLQRPFGRFLDGFADVLTYIVFPLLLLRHVGDLQGVGGALIGLLFVCAAISRLAVFNEIGNVVTAEDRLSYLGMPVFWGGLACGPLYVLHLFLAGAGIRTVVDFLLVAYAVCMVANARFWKPKSMALIAVLTLCGFFAFGLLALGLIPVQP